MACRNSGGGGYGLSGGQDLSNELENANIEIAELTGMLCALCNMNKAILDGEYDFDGSELESLFFIATKDGECDDIQYWYEKHTGQDKERLRKKLSDFSIDEIKLIAEMVERDEI